MPPTTAHTNGEARPPSQQRTASMTEDLGQIDAGVRSLASGISELVGDLEQTARRQLSQRPYAALAAGVGLGYVLGGGVPKWIAHLAIGLGTRVAFEAATRGIGALFTNERRPTGDAEAEE